MRYYIYENDKAKGVAESEYEAWLSLEKEKYVFEDYAVLIDGNQYSIETIYQGAIDKGEGVYPFILLYFEDVFQIEDDGLKVDHDNDKIEYFETFEEMKQRREELIKTIEEKIPQR